MKRKKILFAPSHFVYSSKLGSEFNETYAIINKLKETKEFDIEIICARSDVVDSEIKIHQVWSSYPNNNTNNFNNKDSIIFSLKYFIYTFYLILIKRNRYDIIHHNRPFAIFSTANLFFILFNSKALKVVGPFASPYKLQKSKTYLLLLVKVLKFLNRLTLNRVDVILINDAETVETVKKIAPNKDIIEFPVGKDVNSCIFKQKTYKNIDKQVKILAIGQLIERKNFEYLIKVFNQLIISNQNKEICLTIIGDGPKRDQIILLIEKFKLNKSITIIKSIPYDQIAQFYEDFDYFMLTPKEEAFAHVYIEAMMHGLPIFTSSTTASRSIIGNLGVIDIACNVDSFAEQISKVINNRELSIKLSCESRINAEKKYDLDTVLIPKLIDIYNTKKAN